jgi:NTP pyrophosphatase (non-canonical NTP hydrolase)
VSYKATARFVEYPYAQFIENKESTMNDQTHNTVESKTSMEIDLSRYKNFVMMVTSEESRVMGSFIERAAGIHYGSEHLNVPLLLTALIGLTSETGEAQEIMKKILFQGKPFTEETRNHLKKELGDVIWYWMNACNALQLDPNEVITHNIEKLQSRYPGGRFNAYYSENRKEGDI